MAQLVEAWHIYIVLSSSKPLAGSNPVTSVFFSSIFYGNPLSSLVLTDLKAR